MLILVYRSTQNQCISFNIFKVMVFKSGETMWFGMGVVFGDYDFNVMPGWEDGTVGYHTDDRKIFDAEEPDYGKKTTGR